MNDMLLYLLKSGLLLGLLYATYHFLLRKEVFFSFNRFFLVAAVAFSFLFSLVSFDLFTAQNGNLGEQLSQIGRMRTMYHTAVEAWTSSPSNVPQSKSWLWQARWWKESIAGDLLLASVSLVYLAGLLFLIARFLLVNFKIRKWRREFPSSRQDGLNIVLLPAYMTPFSFLKTVYLPNHLYEGNERDQILAHEKVHIQQRHSIDLIFVQLAAAIMWFNPVIWLLLKSLKQTHEYLADKHMLQQGFSLVEYQSLLLKQLISNNSYGLVHNFNLSFIKKRITMMSIKESSWIGRSKAALALCLSLLIGLLSAQSNTNSGISKFESNDALSAEKKEIQFYLDGQLIRNGLTFSDLEEQKGRLRFELDNDEEDFLHLGIELIRKGAKAGHASRKFREGRSIQIKDLLSKAYKDDFLIIDVTEGPEEVVKLYKFPLFKESEVWQLNQGSALPPPPVSMLVNGMPVGQSNSLPLSTAKAEAYDMNLEYVLSGMIDFEVLTRQNGDVKVTLTREGVGIKRITSKGVQRNATIPLKEVLMEARSGDVVMVAFGDPKGFRFESSFLIK